MKRITAIALAAGLALFITLLVWRGWPAVQALFDRAQLRIGWVALYYAAPLLCATASWRWLFMPGRGPKWHTAAHVTWVGLAVNWLMPVAQVGGEVVKVWLLARRRTSTDAAFASVVVDKTLQVATQVVFTIVGLALFLAERTQYELVIGIVTGMGLLAVGAGLFYRMQRRGLFAMVARLAEKFVSAARAEQIKANATDVDEQVRATYRRRGRLAAAAALRMTFRLVMVGEVVLAAWMLDLDLTLGEALVIESLIQAVRAGAFLIPGGLGAQDGALVLLGVSLGLSSEGALAIALCKRARELMVGLPALGAWQIEHSRRALGHNTRNGRNGRSCPQ